MAGLTDLTRDFAKQFNVTQANARQCIEFLCGNIVDRVAAGETVNIRNFGVFKSKRIGARTIKNPQTHEPTDLPPSVRVCFTATEAMKNTIKRAQGLPVNEKAGADVPDPDEGESAEPTEGGDGPVT